MGRRDEDRKVTPGVWPTLLLSMALVIPFFVKMATGFEPHPAVILPEGGSSLTKDDGKVTYGVTALFARASSGELVEVDADRFLDPIPFHYLFYLGRNEFNLGELDDPVVRLRGTDWSFDLPRHRPSAEERDEVREWLRERLSEQGLADDLIVIRRIETQAAVDSGAIVATRVTSEVTIDL